ncbi:hypothetical protein B6D60_11330 [candidate division KSB1 bacterium 4484_87]|nr:MAG: hypothetical protein B6D60_11330 [candidate division KSB1 bacterium 4484_87]
MKKKKNLNSGKWFFIISILLFAGCAGSLSTSKPDLSTMSIAKIRHRVEQNYLRFQTAKAKAKISLESPQLSFTANSAIRIKMPDSLLIQLNSGLGFGVGSIFVDRNRVEIYSSMENALFVGHPDSMNFRRFLMVNVSFDKLLQAFSGIHLIEQHEREMLQIDENSYLVIGSKNGYTLKYWIHPQRFVVQKYQLLDNNGKVFVEFKYDQFVKSHDVYLPKTVRISQPAQKSRLTIVFTTVKVNTKMRPEDFQIRTPKNVERVIL